MNEEMNPSLATALFCANPADQAGTITDYLQDYGQTFYDASVTQLEHSLQSASLARKEQAPNYLVVAALLHDIGHLLVDEHAATTQFRQNDLSHETVAANYLEPFLPTRVCQPIRLHVPAKRYLYTTDPAYFASQSDSSKRSFQVQGGKMSPEQQAHFKTHRHLQDSLQLRRWDDQATVATRIVDPLVSYQSEFETAFGSQTAAPPS